MKRWLKAAGLEDMPVLWSLEADHLMYRVARGGQGVAIASAVAVADDLETGAWFALSIWPFFRGVIYRRREGRLRTESPPFVDGSKTSPGKSDDGRAPR